MTEDHETYSKEAIKSIVGQLRSKENIINVKTEDRGDTVVVTGTVTLETGPVTGILAYLPKE